MTDKKVCKCIEKTEEEYHEGVNILDLTVCVCNKKELCEPLNMSYVCTVCDGVGLVSGTKKLDNILSEYRTPEAVFYIAKGCGGCQFTKHQIETDYSCALASGIEYCIYQKGPNFKKDPTNKEYLSDSLKEDFLEYINKKNFKVKIMDLIESE